MKTVAVILIALFVVFAVMMVAAQGEGAHICNTFECNFTPMPPAPTAYTPDPVERGARPIRIPNQPAPPLYTPAPAPVAVATSTFEQRLFQALRIIWTRR